MFFQIACLALMAFIASRLRLNRGLDEFAQMELDVAARESGRTARLQRSAFAPTKQVALTDTRDDLVYKAKSLRDLQLFNRIALTVMVAGFVIYFLL